MEQPGRRAVDRMCFRKVTTLFFYNLKYYLLSLTILRFLIINNTFSNNVTCFL